MYKEAASSQASQQGQGPQGPAEEPETEPAGSEEDVVDAEYEVVDDEKNTQS
jgi:hypothetical protein